MRGGLNSLVISAPYCLGTPLPEVGLMNWQPVRRLAREALIFTLLGPVAVALGYMAIQAYKAPSPAAHSVARMCPNYLSKKDQPDPVAQPAAPPVKPGWARINTKHDTRLYKRCHFNGYMACLGQLDESVATLHPGEEVKLLQRRPGLPMATR